MVLETLDPFYRFHDDQRQKHHGGHQLPILNRQWCDFEDQRGSWDGEYRELHHE